jgi:hypothetical protein
MDLSEIEKCWEIANLRYSIDPVYGDEVATSLLYNRPEDAAVITDNIAGMEIVKSKYPEFFAAFDYEWAFQDKIWRKPLEANFQARLFQMMGAFRKVSIDSRHYNYNNVVARYTFESSSENATPFHTAIDSCHFIVSPFSFNEFLMLLTRSFIDSFHGDGTWNSLSSFTGLKRKISPFLRQAILRHITTEAFHSSFPGDSPLEIVKSKSTWFSSASDEGKVCESFETALTYSITDFALAHELGHRLLEHSGKSVLSDLRLKKELEADNLAYSIFVASWGWRDEILDDCPFSPGARVMMGPVMFHMFISWIRTLRVAVAERTESIKKNSTSDEIDEHMEEETERLKATLKQMGEYETSLRDLNFKFEDNDAPIFSSLINCTAHFKDYIHYAVNQIPEADFKIAVESSDIGF